MSDFDDLLLYYRGTAIEVQEERNPWRLYLTKDHCEVPIFQRLFLLLKLKPAEMRGAEIAAVTGIDQARAVRMVTEACASICRRACRAARSTSRCSSAFLRSISRCCFPIRASRSVPFDKLKLCVTAGGGTAAGVAGTATKILAATNPLTLAVALAGLSAVIFRQVMGFFNTRNRYMMMLAQNLYFCSLANNHGALTLIADSAEEEDLKEDMLLYAFLARSPSHRDALPALRVEISDFLRERCGADVDYDAEDALRRLKVDGLVSVASDGTITAIAPEEARAHLDRLWDRLLDVDTLDKAASSGTA